MVILKTGRDDVVRVMEIYERARATMAAIGNVDQWREGYPSEATLWADIDAGGSYVITDGNGRVAATFFFIIGPEPTYSRICDGEWLNDDTYGVIHRVASDGTIRGVMRRVLDYCFSKAENIRIDTHRDNAIMRRALAGHGFNYCGIIHLANGDERLAYQLSRSLFINPEREYVAT